MSRIGKLPIQIPTGVTVSVDDNNVVTVKGAKASISQPVNKCITVHVEPNKVVCTRANDESKVKAMHGLYRTLINNAVIGVTKGYTKSLDIKGVGYKVQKVGDKVVMNIGYSHPVEVVETDDVKLNCPTINTIECVGFNKELVGAMAAKIRAIKPVEPYHGYGIKYSYEVITLKQGKTGAKK